MREGFHLFFELIDQIHLIQNLYTQFKSFLDFFREILLSSIHLIIKWWFEGQPHFLAGYGLFPTICENIHSMSTTQQQESARH